MDTYNPNNNHLYLSSNQTIQDYMLKCVIKNKFINKTGTLDALGGKKEHKK